MLCRKNMSVQSRIRKELRILQVAGSASSLSSSSASSSAMMAAAISVRSTSSNKENDAALSPTSASKIKKEAQSLRRELAQRTDERAQVELELLNAVDGLEEEKSALVDKLRAAIHQRDEASRQIDSLNQQVSDMKRERAIDNNAHEKTMQMLKIKCRDLDEAVHALELADQEVRRLKVKEEEREVQSSRDDARIERLEAELEPVSSMSDADEKGNIHKMSAEIEQLHAALAEANAVIDEKGSIIEGLKDEMARNTSSKQKEMGDLDEQNKTLRHEIQVVNSVLLSTEKINDELNDQIEALRDQQTLQLPNTNVDNLRQELEIAKHRNAELESELNDYRAAIDTFQKEKAEVANSIDRHLREIASGNSQLRARLNAKEFERLALRGEMATAPCEKSSTVAFVSTAMTKEQRYQSPRTVMEPVAMVSPDRDEINPPSCGLKGDEAAQRLRDYKKEKRSKSNRARIPLI